MARIPALKESSDIMLDFDVAQSRLASAGKLPDNIQTCSLDHACGRVLAQPLAAVLDLPPADNSAMDGYAIRHTDCHPGKRFPVQQRCFAGQQPETLLPGHAIRLFTGSLIPPGADTVVMQEDCTENDNTLEIQQLPAAGTHIRKRGEDVQRGKILLPQGARLSGAELALLASQGYAEVPVFSKLKVGVLTTGDELVAPGEARGEEQIYNSNAPMLAALAGNMGADVHRIMHAADNEDALQAALATLLDECDLVLTAGGVSVGEKDLVKPAIERFGGKLDLWRVCMKPGKPVALAHVGHKPIICLPGNPVSAFVVFTVLVTPLIRTMQGRKDVFPPIQYGRLDTAKKFNDTREEFIRVRAEFTARGENRLSPYALQGSGIISSLPWATGLARIPANIPVADHDIVRYYDLSQWLD